MRRYRGFEYDGQSGPETQRWAHTRHHVSVVESDGDGRFGLWVVGKRVGVYHSLMAAVNEAHDNGLVPSLPPCQGCGYPHTKVGVAYCADCVQEINGVA